MKKVLFFAVALFVCAGIFAQEKIAVFPFEDMSNVFSQTEMTFFYRQFSNEFTNRNAGRFTIVPRSDVDRLINIEAEFQISEFSAREKTAEMNSVLNGTQILSGIIGRVSGRIAVSVSLYTYPELSQLPGGVDLTVTNSGELFDKIPELVQSMQNNIGGGSPPPEQPPANRTYQIGDTGPAGGIVFFDRGFTGDGWRYLEAAPVGAEFTAEWGAYGQNVANTMTAVGFGKQNTQIIVDRLRQLNQSNRAAQICVSLDINGYKDWFLPSRDELKLMYTNLKSKGLGGFSNSWYWCSSQANSRNAWSRRFSDGSQGELHNKHDTNSVRAVRAF